MATTKAKTPIENIVIFGFAGLLVLFMILEGLFNMFNTFYGQNAAAAGAAWKVAGLVGIGISVIILYVTGKSNKGVTTGAIILAGIFLVLAFCAFAGFRFDIA